MDSSRPLTRIGSSRLSSPAKSPEFFKIINPTSVLNQNLILPKTFVCKYGRNLGGLVHLKVPTGAVWEVKLVKYNEEAYLSNGWEEFAKYYSIRLWHFLVFRYEGNSTFHVTIFDMTSSEIEYPHKLNENLFFHKPDEQGSRKAHSIKMSGNRSSFDTGEIASAFKSDNPFFTVKMHESCVVKRCGLSIPNDFAKKYIRQDQDTVELHVPDGRVWFAKCYKRMEYYYCRLDCFSFVRDNKIEVGDVCIFELIDPLKLLMNVIIVRKSQHQTTRLPEDGKFADKRV